MLETVREFGLERLIDRGELAMTNSRHAAYFADFAQGVASNLAWRADSTTAALRLDADLDNLRSALAWTAEHDPNDTFLRLAVALESYWIRRGLLVEGRAWLDRALGQCESAPTSLQSAVVRAVSWLARHQGDLDLAEKQGEAGLALSRKDDDAEAVSHALTILGFVAGDRGDYARATALFDEVLAMGPGLALPSRTAWTMRNLGRLALLSGDIKAATDWQEQALAIFRQEDHRFGVAYVLSELADIALARGEFSRAGVLWRERLGLTWDLYGLYWALEGLAAVAVAQGQPQQAARFLGAAEAHRERMGIVQAPRRLPQYEQTVAATRASLDKATLSDAWSEGRRWSAEAARAEAIQIAEAAAQLADLSVTPRAGNGTGLTRRELEVVRLVASGHSNREVADTLCISVDTVKRHVSNILAKLDLPSRSALTAYAHTHGLT
jgi:non-specific serine/threonine protein kinase